MLSQVIGPTLRSHAPQGLGAEFQGLQVYEKRPEADAEEKKHGSKSTLFAVNHRGQHSMEKVRNMGLLRRHADGVLALV